MAINLNAGRTTITNVPITAGQQKIYAATQYFYDTVGSLTAYGTQPISTNTPASLRFSLRQAALHSIAPMSLNGKITAFDVVETPVAKQAAINDLTSSSVGGFINVVRIGFANLINAFTNNAFVNVPVNVLNRAILPDGSSFIAKYNFQTGEYEYVENSAKDAVGNPIPDDAVMAAGGPNSSQKYVFPNTAPGQMSGISQVQHMNNLGIRVDVVRTGSTWMVACVSSSGRTTCTASLVR